MSIVFVLIILAILIAVCFLITFIFSCQSGQFDDLSTPAHRILFDDEKVNLSNNNKEKDNEQ